MVKSNGYKLAFVASDVDCQPIPQGKPRKTSMGQNVPFVRRLPEATKDVAVATGQPTVTTGNRVTPAPTFKEALKPQTCQTGAAETTAATASTTSTTTSTTNVHWE